MYSTLSEANEYFEGRMFSDSWIISDNARRTQALTHAARLIDRLVFTGDKTDEDQEHQFPRDDETEVPQNIKFASYEIALALLDSKNPEDMDLNVTSEGILSSRASYDRSFAAPNVVHGIPSGVAWSYILPYLKEQGKISMNRVS